MADRYDEDQRMDTASIRADIRDTRERMSHTLDELGGRLNTNVLKQQARETFEERKQELKDNLREATIGRAEHMARNAAGRVTETRRGIVDAIRDNPIPAAMVGIGLGWLFYNGRRDETVTFRSERDMGYWTGGDNGFRQQEQALGEPSANWGADTRPGMRDRASELTGHAQETVSDFADRTREMTSNVAGRTREVTSQIVDRTSGAIGDTAGRVREAAGSFASTTRQQTHRLEDRFHDAVVDSPLVVGAAAIALGLTAGLAIPSTRRESQLMGARRDQLFDQARDRLEDTSGRVQQVAQRVIEEAQSTVQEVVQDARSTMQEVVQDARSTVQEAAEGLKTTARDAAREQGLMGGGSATTGTGATTGTTRPMDTSTDAFDTGTSRWGTTGTGTAGTAMSGSGLSTTGSAGTGMSGAGMSGTGTSGTGMSGAGSTGTGSTMGEGLSSTTGSKTPTGPSTGSIADPRES